MKKRGKAFYVLLALRWTVLVTAGGALAGAIIYSTVGLLAGVDTTAFQLVKKGARELGFLAFIWAPGIGIVLAFHRAYLDRRAEPPTRES